MSDKNIKVKFPSEMKVHSPEIDSIKKTAQRISNWLHNDFKEIIKPLQVLPKIPEILRDFKEKITEQFSMLFTNMIDTQIVSRHANIKVSEKKVQLVEEHIDKKEIQFNETKKRIIDRFQNLSNKLDEMHSKFLKQLDNHVYDIPEKIYPIQIQEKFSFSSIPTKNYIIAHTQESALTRFEVLNDEFDKVQKNIHSFLDERNDFYDQLSWHNADLDEGQYGLPYWAVEVEDAESGEKRTEIYFSWELQNEETKIPNNTIGIMRDYAKGNFEYRSVKESNLADKQKVVEILNELNEIPEDEIKRFEDDCKEISIN